jgi:hypothetical protein
MTVTATLCDHHYLRTISPTTSLCRLCGELLPTPEKTYDTGPLEMPPFVYQITEDYWRHNNPWPSITRGMALYYRWYGSVIFGRQYLVMPVYDATQTPVFFSARCLREVADCKFMDEKGKVRVSKYYTPVNRRRVMWKSWIFDDDPEPVEDVLLVGEGVADAAWLSNLAPSVALLGTEGKLDRPFILLLDGDGPGIEAGFEIIEEAKSRGIVESKTVILPANSDPTDWSVPSLRAMIEEQTGVQL